MDITQRKNTEIALEESETKFKSYFNNNPTAAFVFEYDNNEIINNPGSQKDTVKSEYKQNRISDFESERSLKPDPITLLGEVRNINYIQDKGYRLGIQIEEMSDNDQDKLMGVVSFPVSSVGK